MLVLIAVIYGASLWSSIRQGLIPTVQNPDRESVANLATPSAELFDRLSVLGADLLIETLDKLPEITPIKQDEDEATYTAKITKELCPIDWNKPNTEVHNKVRGLQTWPVATAVLNSKDVKIHSTLLCDKSGNAGEIISLDPLTVACSSGSVIIKELQLSGKKRMDSKAFLLGHPLRIGDKFN